MKKKTTTTFYCTFLLRVQLNLKGTSAMTPCNTDAVYSHIIILRSVVVWLNNPRHD